MDIKEISLIVDKYLTEIERRIISQKDTLLLGIYEISAGHEGVRWGAYGTTIEPGIRRVYTYVFTNSKLEEITEEKLKKDFNPSQVINHIYTFLKTYERYNNWSLNKIIEEVVPLFEGYRIGDFKRGRYDVYFIDKERFIVYPESHNPKFNEIKITSATRFVDKIGEVEGNNYTCAAEEIKITRQMICKYFTLD